MVLFIGEITFNGSPAQKIRGMPKALRAALESSVKLWHKIMLPKHFVPLAVRRYGYKPRGRGYMVRKARKKGHQKPIVWTGLTRESMTTRIFIGSTGRSNTRISATGRMFVPFYIGTKSRGGKRPDYRRELTATTAQEEAALRNHIRGVLVNKLQLTKHVEKRKVG